MSGTRSSKRVAGLDVDEELPTKRSARRPAPTQKVLDGQKPPTSTTKRRKKRGKDTGKQPQRNGTPCPIPLSHDQPLFTGNSEVLRSSPPSNSTPLPNPPRVDTRHSFDPTRELVTYTQFVAIQLE
jgi:hypothetical protein